MFVIWKPDLDYIYFIITSEDPLSLYSNVAIIEL
jgi:hypothetical protein